MINTPHPRPHCPICGQHFLDNWPPKRGGRPRIYCKNRCRQAAYRLRLAKKKSTAPQPDQLPRCSCGVESTTMPGPLHHHDCPMGPEHWEQLTGKAAQ